MEPSSARCPSGSRSQRRRTASVHAFSLLFVLILYFHSSTAITCPTPEHFFAVNRVRANCLSTGVGAIPYQQTSSTFEYNFRAFAEIEDRVSLVQSSGGDTYVDCSDTAINTETPTSTSSGWMAPESVNRIVHTVKIRKEDSRAAVEMLAVASYYEVCHWSNFAWSNKYIRVSVQNKLLGMEIAGIRNAGGIRSSVVKLAGYKPTFNYIYGPGATPSLGDAFAIVAVSADCAAVSNTVSSLSSGFLANPAGPVGQFEDSNDLIATYLDPADFQVCFRFGAAGTFSRTGVGVLVQQDVVAVVMNAIRSSTLATVFPRQEGNTLSLTRVELPSGYQQVIRQRFRPIAFYSFEDLDPSIIADTHCLELPCVFPERAFPGSVVNPVARSELGQYDVGTGKSISLDGETSYARIPHNITTAAQAFSVCWLMKPTECAACSPTQSLLSYDGEDRPYGALDMVYYKDSRKVSVKLEGYRDLNQDVPSATVLFDYQFALDEWTHACVAMDATSGAGELRLLIDAQLYLDPSGASNMSWVGGQGGAPTLSQEEARIRVGPTTLAAWQNEPGSYRDLFAGELDELAVYEAALTPEDLQTQLAVSPTVDSVKPLEGSVVLAGLQADCDDAQYLPDAEHLQWSSQPMSGDVKSVTGNLALLASLNASSYQLCYSRSRGEMLSTGFRVRLQDDVSGVEVNGVQHARGLRTGMPSRGSNVVVVRRKEGAGRGEAVSLVQASGSCEDTAQTNPPACSSSASGWLPILSPEGLALDGELCSMAVGVYQVCYRSSDAASFTATGVSVTTQQDMLQLSVNFLIPGDGHRVVAPVSNFNALSFSTASSLLSAPFPGQIQNAGVDAIVRAEVAVIASGGDCEQDASNPAPLPNSTGALPTEFTLAYDAGSDTSFITEVELEGRWPMALAALGEGTYEVCLSVVPAQAPTSFKSTGISLAVQARVAAVSVNRLRAGFGVRVGAPRKAGSSLLITRPAPDAQPLNVSLIPRDKDCPNSAHNPPCASASCGAGSTSGYMAVGEEGGVLDTDVLGRMDPGLYQLCLDPPDGPPISTGISLRLQDEFLGLVTNGLRPSTGVRVALPRTIGNRLSWDVKSASVLNFLTLVDSGADCVLNGEEGQRVDIETAAVYTANLYNADSDSLDTALLNLSAAVYQVCFSVDGSTPMLGTGVSLEVQRVFEGLLVNGVDMRPLYHPEGIVATVPRRAGSILRVLSGPAIQDATPGRAISVIGADDTCSEPASNPPSAEAGVAASGHMPLATDDASATGTASLAALAPGVYQMCHRAGAGAEFEATGVSVRVQEELLGVWAEDVLLHDGLHAAVTRKLASRLYLNGSLPDGTFVGAKTPAFGKVGFVPAAGADDRDRCKDVVPGGSAPVLDIARDGSLAVAEVDALWGPGGTGPGGLLHICIEKGGRFEPTGTSLEVKEGRLSIIGSIIINDVQFWSVAYLPYESSGVVIKYELTAQFFQDSHAFLLIDTLAAPTRTCAQEFDSPFSRLIRASGGVFNQSDVDYLFGDFADLSHSREYRICFTPTGAKADLQETGLSLYGQLHTSGLTLNGVDLGGGGVASLPKIPGNRLRFNKRNRPYVAGEAIAFIALQGECADPDDNPSALTAGSSGDLVAVAADGVVEVDGAVAALGSYTYQICYRGPTGPWEPTGLAVAVANSMVIRQVTAEGLSPGRGDTPLLGVDVYIETNQGASVLAYPGSEVVASLYRCTSACGTFAPGHTACSVPCTAWVDVTESLAGRTALVNADGVAQFRSLTVQKNAGRFYLELLWLLDGVSTDRTAEFIVLPYTVRVAGITPNQVFTVGDNFPGPTRDRCRLGLVDLEDVRCRGSALLENVRGEFVDVDGEVLDMVGETVGFEMVAALMQGQDGYEDANHAFVAEASDLFQDWMFRQGYAGEKSAPVHEGVAAFAGDFSLRVRRQGGQFYQLHLYVKGFPPDSAEDYLRANSASFSLMPADMIVKFATGASLGGVVYADVPEDVGDYVHLPPAQMTLVDGAGYTLSNMRCKDCLFPRLETYVVDACDTFNIPDPGCSNTGEPWAEAANSFCDPAITAVELIRWPPGYVPTPEECQARCDLEPDCFAVTVYPQDVVDDPALPVSGRCYKSLLDCQVTPSAYSATIYFKPGGASTGIAPECICPVEEYDGRTFYETLWSPFYAVGTRHVIVSSVTAGESAQAALYTKYAGGVSLRLLYKLRGVDLERYSRPVTLVPRPALLDWDRAPFVEGRCACFARPGLEVVPVVRPAQPWQEPLTIDPDFPYGVGDLESYNTQAMVEMEAISCVCVLPAPEDTTSVSEGEGGEGGPGPQVSVPDSRICVGCCHEQCL